jgi:hypothetical protein
MRRLRVVLVLLLSGSALAGGPTQFLETGATALNSLKGPFLGLVLALLALSLIAAVVHAVVGAFRNG